MIRIARMAAAGFSLLVVMTMVAVPNMVLAWWGMRALETTHRTYPDVPAVGYETVLSTLVSATGVVVLIAGAICLGMLAVKDV